MDVGKYPISVASNLTGVVEHKLRAFETAGLLDPSRTEGGTRLYSDADLEMIQKIADLGEKGINAAGIREILNIPDNGSADEQSDGDSTEGD